MINQVIDRYYFDPETHTTKSLHMIGPIPSNVVFLTKRSQSSLRAYECRILQGAFRRDWHGEDRQPLALSTLWNSLIAPISSSTCSKTWLQ